MYNERANEYPAENTSIIDIQSYTFSPIQNIPPKEQATLDVPRKGRATQRIQLPINSVFPLPIHSIIFSESGSATIAPAAATSNNTPSMLLLKFN
jgi:hypothetical protein